MVLNLAQVVAERTDALRLLEEAYNAGLGIDGDRAVVLDSMLETARAKGFFGSLELAVGVLRVSGRFQVKRGPVGKWRAVRQPTAMIPITEPRSTALIPVAGPSSRALVPIADDRLNHY